MSAKELAAAASSITVGTFSRSGDCPADTGSVNVIAFGCRNEPAVDLWWHSTGCQTIDNGATEAEQAANNPFGHFQIIFAALTRSAS